MQEQDPSNQEIHKFSAMLTFAARAILQDFVNTQDAGEMLAAALNVSEDYRDMMLQASYSTLRMIVCSMHEGNDEINVVNESLEGIAGESGFVVGLRMFILENHKMTSGERQLSWPVDDNYLGRFAT